MKWSQDWHINKTSWKKTQSESPDLDHSWKVSVPSLKIEAIYKSVKHWMCNTLDPSQRSQNEDRTTLDPRIIKPRPESELGFGRWIGVYLLIHASSWEVRKREAIHRLMNASKHCNKLIAYEISSERNEHSIRPTLLKLRTDGNFQLVVPDLWHLLNNFKHQEMKQFPVA